MNLSPPHLPCPLSPRLPLLSHPYYKQSIHIYIVLEFLVHEIQPLYLFFLSRLFFFFLLLTRWEITSYSGDYWRNIRDDGTEYLIIVFSRLLVFWSHFDIILTPSILAFRSAVIELYVSLSTVIYPRVKRVVFDFWTSRSQYAVFSQPN